MLKENNKEVFTWCKKKVIYRTEGVECEACLVWYHLGCSKISEPKYASIAETVGYCLTRKKPQEADWTKNGV